MLWRQKICPAASTPAPVSHPDSVLIVFTATNHVLYTLFASILQPSWKWLGRFGSWKRFFAPLQPWFLSQRLHGAGLVRRVLRRRSWRRWGLTGLGQHHWLGSQRGGFELYSHAGRYHRLEGAHIITGGAGAAAEGRLGVGGGPQHDTVDWAEGLAGAGRCGTPATAARGLPLLQGVQHHVGGVLGWALPLQLAQLIQSSVHCFLYVLQETRESVCVRGWGGGGGEPEGCGWKLKRMKRKWVRKDPEMIRTAKTK